jgi:glyoxylate reductase
LSESIVITRQLPGLQDMIEILPENWKVWISPHERNLRKEELIEKAHDATGILVFGERITEEVLEQLPKLKAITTYSVGLDHIDLEAAARRNITVANLPDEVTYTTAELGMTLILACTRRLLEADRIVRKSNPYFSNSSLICGNNLQGKTLGVVGFGRIGQRVAKMAKAFEMNIIYYNRSKKPDAEKELNAEYRELDQLLNEADVVILCVPGGEETKHLIGSREISLLKPTAIIVNIARGTVVDEQALTEALKEGRIKAAGLDVYEREPRTTPGLVELDNVILTPHIGTTTLEAQLQMTARALEKLRDSLLNRK